MKRRGVTTKLAAGFAVIVLSVSCVGGFCGWSAFEREILNARIHFIYHVTIQKPGRLELGWGRFRKAQAPMPKLTATVAGSPTLASLRPPAQQLAADLDRYEVVLRRVLEAVAEHIL